MALLQLPNELLAMITNYLDIKDISRTCRSCNALYQVLDHILYYRVDDKVKALFNVIDRGQTRAVRKLLAAGANPDQALFAHPLYDAVGTNPSLRDYQMQLMLLDQHNRRMQRSSGLSDQVSSLFWTPLHLAAGWGHDDIVNLLLDHGANVNALSYGFCYCIDMPKFLRKLRPELPGTDKTEFLWWMPLHTAICYKKYSTAYILVTRGAPFQVASRALGSSSSYVTALHISSCTASIDFCSFLLDYYKPPIDIRDHRGMSPLHWAYRADRWDMVKWLVRNGADINASDNDGCTLLLDACATARFSTALDLIELGACPHPGFTTTPLHCCCDIIIPPKSVVSSSHEWWRSDGGDQLKLIKRLVETGADVNALSDDGDTPLALAADRGLYPIVEYLLDAGAALGLRDDRGMTPLMRACMLGSLENYQLSTVRVLLQRGASVTDVDSEGRNAMEIVCSRGNAHRDTFAIVKLLLEYGSPHNAVSSSTKSLIFPLYMSGNTEVCEHLMTLNTKNPSRKELDSMIFEAIKSRDADSLRFVLQFKDATKVLNTKTRLLHAIETQNFAVAHVILDAGAPWEHVSRTGWTAFLYACKGGNVPLARILLERGADPNQPTKAGETPLDLAVAQGDVTLFELLLDNGASPYPPLIYGPRGKPHAGALFQAVQCQRSGIVEAIMRRNLFCSAPAVEKIRSMYYLCNQGTGICSASNECLKALLRGGADPNMPLLRPSTLDYCLPLQVAMAEQNQEAVELLLNYGATPLK
ncbi:ankyrin [Daldinia bambusicola]|nr:ankyrin [Daldinia bambusicola]